VLSLDFLTVADLSETVAGQFCARRFADHGADVVLVEPREGSRLRVQPGVFSHLNTGKRSVVADEAERAELVRRADVVILPERYSPDVLAAKGTVFCALTEFGRIGPRAGWRGNELVHQSLSGLAHSTGTDGRAPLFGFGHRAYYAAGAAGFAAAMAAVVERQRSGLGQLVEVSVAEVAATTSPSLIAQFDYNGTYPLRGAYPGLVGTYQCRDGWVVIFILSGRWQAACAAFGLDELVADERFATAAALNRNWPVASAAIAGRLRAFDVATVVKLGQENRFAVESVLDVATIMADQDRWVTGFWAEEESGQLVNAPGPLSGSEPKGTDARTVLSAWPKRPEVTPATTRSKPLAGCRVLELTTAWAGPLTGRSLAFLGAEVIKVESIRNIDSWRGTPLGGDARRYPGLVPGTRPHNRSSWFNTENNDKLSVELDLKNADALAVMHELVALSDVLVCNLAPGALSRLGLDYAALSAIREDIVLMEINGFGANSPMSDHVAVGPTVEATTGMMTLIGYGDGVPHNSGSAYLDPLAGLLSTGLVLSALAAKAVTGQGRHLELNLRGVGLQLLGDYLHEYAGSGVTPQVANASRDVCPHGVFPAAGHDEWLAVAATDDQQWRTLCHVMKRADLADDPELAGLGGRLANRAVIEAAVEAWSRDQDKHDAATLLQAQGIPAAPVCTGADLADDPHLAATGFYQTLPHPEAGTYRYQGLPYRLHGTPGEIRRAAPCLGANTRDVLDRVLGKAEADIAKLLAGGAATDNS
jgi:crotonobetainyl-CoA:carnitine CoA-transferase CaiB-like acyl-CoA transferase